MGLALAASFSIPGSGAQDFIDPSVESRGNSGQTSPHPLAFSFSLPWKVRENEIKREKQVKRENQRRNCTLRTALALLEIAHPCFCPKRPPHDPSNHVVDPAACNTTRGGFKCIHKPALNLDLNPSQITGMFVALSDRFKSKSEKEPLNSNNCSNNRYSDFLR